VTAPESRRQGSSDIAHRKPDIGAAPKPQPSFEEKKRLDADARKARKEVEARQRRVSELESRIAAAESAIKELEAMMSAPGFYENHEAAKPIIDRHQALMWEVGELMNKWETLQAETEV
jgi:ATP-binding cassette subfamily F protein 3